MHINTFICYFSLEGEYPSGMLEYIFEWGDWK